MKKYIVVDTWNGEGYSTENGVEIKQFNDKQDATDWAFSRCFRQRIAQNNSSSVSSLDNGYLYFEPYDEHAGTYQVVETSDVYAVMIRCNINDVETLTKEEYYNKIQELDGLYGEELDDYLDVEENGDRFYHSHVDDYDYQFRLIENLD